MIETIFGVGPHLTWAQECARTVVVFVLGLTLLRLSGRRTFSKWSSLDTVVSIIAGSSLSRAITGAAPMFGTLLATTLLMILHSLLARLCAHSQRASAFFEGRPVALAQNGSVDHAARLRHSVSRSDLEEALRQMSVAEVGQTSRITLEPSGRITILKN